jgi:hypothetical protein
LYKAHAETLARLAGVALPPPVRQVFNSIPIDATPRVVLSPSFVTTLSDAAAKVKSGGVRFADSLAALVVDGEGVSLEDVSLRGALVIRAVPGATVAVRGLQARRSLRGAAALHAADTANGCTLRAGAALLTLLSATLPALLHPPPRAGGQCRLGVGAAGGGRGGAGGAGHPGLPRRQEGDGGVCF